MRTVNFKDFPKFNNWNFNSKEFELRALNNLSIRFNSHLDDTLDFIKKYPKEVPEDLVAYLSTKIVEAARYSLFGNRIFEAEGPNSYGGGDDSIQEQFICWAMEITPEDYRKDRGKYAYNPTLCSGPGLIKWLETSKLLQEVKWTLRYRYGF